MVYILKLYFKRDNASQIDILVPKASRPVVRCGPSFDIKQAHDEVIKLDICESRYDIGAVGHRVPRRGLGIGRGEFGTVRKGTMGDKYRMHRRFLVVVAVVLYRASKINTRE